MSDVVELMTKAARLASERTDGSQAALYLLVERMRPVLVALVEEYKQFQAELRVISNKQDYIESSFEGLRATNEDLTNQLKWWEDHARAQGWLDGQ